MGSGFTNLDAIGMFATVTLAVIVCAGCLICAVWAVSFMQERGKPTRPPSLKGTLTRTRTALSEQPIKAEEPAQTAHRHRVIIHKERTRNG